MKASAFLSVAAGAFLAGSAQAQTLFEQAPGTVISIDLAALPAPYTAGQSGHPGSQLQRTGHCWWRMMSATPFGVSRTRGIKKAYTDG
jgi:hypothetical protein